MKLRKFNKRLISFLLLVVCIISVQTPVLATDTNVYMKIGLRRELSNKHQITINSRNINVGYGYEDFTYLPLNLQANSNFVVRPVNGIFVKLPETATTIEELKLIQQSYSLQGYTNTVIYMKDNNQYSLAIGPYDNTSNAQVIVQSLSALGKVPSVLNISSTVSLDIDNNLGVIFGNASLKPQVTTYAGDSYINISNNLNYRGAIQFNIEGAYVQPINVVLLEEYLYGLVPSEMPSSWHSEALKAQSVAARTYAYSAIGFSKHSANGYNLCDSVHCQVYKGVNNEHINTTTAINATVGVVAYSNNTLIEALFSAANGGSTANSEDVWSNEISYLRAKEDPYENGAHQWTRVFTQSELSALVLAIHPNLGMVNNVIIDQKDDYGRVISLTLVCTNGNYTVKKDAIRSFFSNTPDGSLKSTNFEIQSNLSSNSNIDASELKDIDTLTVFGNNGFFDYDRNMSVLSNVGLSNTQANNVNVIDGNDRILSYGSKQIVGSGSVVLSGYGWGHGVGLSQHGAKGMAEQGYNYNEILNFYYTGVELK